MNRDIRETLQFLGEVCLIIVLVMMPITPLIVTSCQEGEEKLYDIVSLERGTENEGCFFLGCGGVDAKNKYYFYVQGDKGMKLESLSTERAYIVETFNIDPCVYRIKKKGEPFAEYVIYVPVGTVVRRFEV